MSIANNPYAHALDGLVLADPVVAFFGFCRAREAVRRRRESDGGGGKGPWSDDVIFQRARFLNVFREDDKVTKALLKMARRIHLSTQRESGASALIRTLFFARWCNRHTTLDTIAEEWARRYCFDTTADNQPLREALSTIASPPWDNVTAYPVGPIQWRGKTYSRFDAATSAFAREDVQRFLLDCVHKSGGDVVDATARINAEFGMENDFPIFMAVMDIAWFRPDLIRPDSPVPVGIGAVPFLELLERHLGFDAGNKTLDQRGNAVFRALIRLQPVLWPEAKRVLQPIDCEYLCCECRKYYSYVNRTKQFSGKNIFVPGKSARLEFDAPELSLEENHGTPKENRIKIAVIAGAPCSGKSTLVEALRKEGFTCHGETAEELLSAGVAAGRTAKDMRKDATAWQMGLMMEDCALFQRLLAKQSGVSFRSRLVFTDTSFVETVVFSRRAGIEISPKVARWLRETWKERVTVYFLAPLPTALYQTTGVRTESVEVARQISEEHRAAYAEFGMDVVEVPPVSVAERVALILQRAGVRPSRL